LAKINFVKFFDYDEVCAVAGDNSRALQRATERTREDLRESRAVKFRAQRPRRGAHLRST
jgi:hypothetical protein